jgi:toxin CptA
LCIHEADYTVTFNEIRLRPSRLLLVVLAIAHLVVLVIVLTMPMSYWITSALTIAVLTSMWHAIWHHALLHGNHGATALKVSGNKLEVMLRSGVWFPTQVLGSSYVSPWLTVLNLRLDGRRLAMHVVLLPDALDHDDFRRLRVWLRWGDVLRHGADGAGML